MIGGVYASTNGNAAPASPSGKTEAREAEAYPDLMRRMGEASLRRPPAEG
jgi:hypothetical protein